MKYLCLLFILLIKITHGQTTPYSKLESKLASTNYPQEKLEILFSLVIIASENDLEHASEFADIGLNLAIKTGDKKWQSKFYEAAGKVRSNLLQFDTARIFLDSAFAGYKSINDKASQATTLIRIGWIHKKRREIEQAMDVDMQALRLMEAAGDQHGISNAGNKLAEDLWKQGRLTEAMKYATSSLDIAKKTGAPLDLLFAYFTIGNVYISLSEFQNALQYYDSAFMFVSKANLPAVDLASLTNNRGNALKLLGKYEDALKSYNASLSIAKKIKLPGGIAVGIANLGEVNLKMGNYKKALEYQLETVRLQENYGDNSNLKENYRHVSSIYEKLGNHKEALEYQKKALIFGDTLSLRENDDRMAELLAQYETEKKEATIAVQQAQLTQQRRIQWLSIGIAILLTLFLFFGYRSYRTRTKTNRLLAERNTEIELLLKEIHHRVKNNLEIVSGLLALQSDQIDDLKTKEAITASQNRVQSIGIVHQKLYQGKNLGAIEMKDYFLNLSESILDSFGAEKRVTIECAMDKLDIDIDTALPLGLIVNELLTNTVKYAFPQGQDGKVLIKLEKSNGMLHLEVSDNGVGKNGLTKGTGFGSQLVSLLTRQLDGTMREETKNGTRVFFDFKLSGIS